MRCRRNAGENKDAGTDDAANAQQRQIQGIETATQAGIGVWRDFFVRIRFMVFSQMICAWRARASSPNPVNAKSSSGLRPLMMLAMELAEPQAWVQPSVP